MRKLTKINTILQNFIDWLQKVASTLAIGATDIEVWGDSWLLASSHAWWFWIFATITASRHQFLVNLLSNISKVDWILWSFHLIKIRLSSFTKLDLTIFTKQLVTFLTLHRFIRELLTDNTLDFFNHFALEFILNFIHLNIKRWYWFGTHHFLDSPFCYRQVKSLIDTEPLFLSIHFLEGRVGFTLHLVHLLDGHL